jgi:hypothetical protein
LLQSDQRLYCLVICPWPLIRVALAGKWRKKGYYSPAYLCYYLSQHSKGCWALHLLLTANKQTNSVATATQVRCRAPRAARPRSPSHSRAAPCPYNTLTRGSPTGSNIPRSCGVVTVVSWLSKDSDSNHGGGAPHIDFRRFS